MNDLRPQLSDPPRPVKRLVLVLGEWVRCDIGWLTSENFGLSSLVNRQEREFPPHTPSIAKQF